MINKSLYNSGVRVDVMVCMLNVSVRENFANTNAYIYFIACIHTFSHTYIHRFRLIPQIIQLFSLYLALLSLRSSSLHLFIEGKRYEYT